MNFNLKDIIAKVRDSITDNKTWQAEKNAVLSQLTEAEEKLQDYMTSAVTATDMKAKFETQIAELTSTHTTAVQSLNDQIKNLSSKIDAEKLSAETKGQAIAASIGITNETQLPKVVTTTLTPEYVSDQMAKDKTFFAKNKETILKLAGIPADRWDSSR